MRSTPQKTKVVAALLTLALMLSTLPVIVAQTPLAFKLAPSTIPAGRTRTIKIKTASNDDLTGFELQKPPEDTGVIIEEPGGQLADNKTAIIARVTVDEDADAQTLPLQIVKKEGDEITETFTVDLTIAAFTPKAMQKQAVPPNLEFQVDSMVQPMSYKGAKDVFGRRVADAYYSIVINLGNNTGFDLQVNKIGFVTSIPMQVPDLDQNQRPVVDSNGKVKTRTELLEITAIDRSLIRSSIEKEQNFGARALALNLLGGVGTVTTGFLPFFHALGPRANFSSFTSVVNGQLKDGFTQAVPDLTIRHLNRLDSSLVMDQDFVLPNNSERNTVVFVPRGSLGLSDIEKDNLLKVREKLGSLIIVGRPIQRFENRQIVVRSGAAGERSRDSGPANPAAPANAPRPVPSPITIESLTPNFGTLSEAKEVVITGSGFSPNEEVKVKVGDRQVPARFLTATEIKVTVPPIATPGTIDVEVIVGDRRDTLENGYTYIDELTVESFDPQSVPIAGETVVKIKGKGFMSGAEVTIDGVVIENVSVSNDHKEITVTVPGHAAGPVTVVVKNPNGKTFSFANAITYTQ
jgi:IPT/TIG domain-containing protein